MLIDYWRPISLLNNNYKILAIIFAKHLKAILDSIMNEIQSGFMRNRHTSTIRLILDILDYPEFIQNDSFILLIDFYKAFDSIEHKLIYKTLKKFGFFLPNRTLYFNRSSSIKLKNGTSPRFELKQGIHQRRPISPYLFLLCTQLLTHIKGSDLKGMSVIDKEILKIL